MVRSGSLTYPRPTQIPEKTMTPGAPSGTRDRCSSTTYTCHVVDGGAERHPLPVRHPVHDLVIGVVRGLRQSVGVDQLDLGLDREPALRELFLQRLAGNRYVPQIRKLARVPLQVGQDDLEVGRHDLEHGDPAIDDLLDEPLDVQDRLLLDQQGSPAHQERGNQLPERDVEALGRGLGDHLPLADLQVVDLGVEVIQHPRVLAHRALRLTRGAGGEVDVGELVGRDLDAEIGLGMALAVGGIDEERLDSGQRVERPAEVGGTAALR